MGQRTAIVVGAGLGGIASALRLRAKGYKVQLIDQCAEIGGRVKKIEDSGFAFDTHAIALHDLAVFEEIFSLYNKNFRDYVDLTTADHFYEFIFPDRSRFLLSHDVEKTLKEIERFNPKDKENYLKLLDAASKLSSFGSHAFCAQTFHDFKYHIAMLPSMLRANAHKSIWSFVGTCIKNPKLRQALTAFSLWHGNHPSFASATPFYSDLQYDAQRYFVQGGGSKLVAALKNLLQQERIKMTLKTKVVQVLIENGTVKGVQLESGRKKMADVVICNADAAYVHQSLLGFNNQSALARFQLRQSSYSSGLFTLCFGVQAQYSDVKPQTVLFKHGYKAFLQDTFKNNILSDDFVLKLSRLSALDPSAAPSGCDAFCVVCPVPNLRSKVDWSVEGSKLSNKIINHLERTLLPGVKQAITTSYFKTPEDFAYDYNAVNGAISSTVPNLLQTGWFRYHNKVDNIENLYLVGAGTHPGAGAANVLQSAKLVDGFIAKAS